jgi:threonine synthase
MRLKPDTDPDSVIDRSLSSLWRYRGVLPVQPEAAVSLTEGWTPLVRVDGSTWIKDEARNPTGSFKARGMSMAVSAAVALGARRLVAPSAGNAAGALAAYGAAAGVEVMVAMPEDTPRPFVGECRHYGAQVELVPGTISDAGRWLADHRSAGDFDLSTLKEPFRVEGKKTMGYELWEQFDGNLPDVIVYPTGGGTGLIGMWKAFDEMETIGWIGPGRPRLVSVQSDGCAPVVEGFQNDRQTTLAWLEPNTIAYGLRVPNPIGGFLCLRALRETKGTAVAVPESAIAPAAAAMAVASGVDACPEAGAAWAALGILRDQGWIEGKDRVVVFNTGTGIKYR